MHLSKCGIVVCFGRIIYKQFVLKKHKGLVKKFVGCVILRYISACVPYNMTVYSGKYMKHAPILITIAAGTVTGLKMWDTNCTQTKYLLSYLMIYMLRH